MEYLRGLILAVGLMSVYGIAESKENCVNNILSEKLSPSENIKAVLFERKCDGAEHPTIEVSIILAVDSLDGDSGNVYVSEGYPESYDIEWKAEKVLFIKSEPWNEWRKTDQYFEIKIEYEYDT